MAVFLRGDSHLPDEKIWRRTFLELAPLFLSAGDWVRRPGHGFGPGETCRYRILSGLIILSLSKGSQDEFAEVRCDRRRGLIERLAFAAGLN